MTASPRSGGPEPLEDVDPVRETRLPADSDRPFGALFEHAPVAMVVSRADGSLVRANREACRLFRGSEPEILRAGRPGLFTDAARRSVAVAVRDTLGAYSGYIRLRRLDGTEFLADVTSTLLPETGGDPLAVTVFRDASRLERESRALRATEDRLGALLDGAFDAVVLADEEARCIDANPAACALLGRSRDALLRTSILDTLQAQRRPEAMQRWMRFLSEGRTDVESVVERPDGTELVVECRGRAGVLPGVNMVVMRDVTDLRRAEAERERANALYRIVARHFPGGIIGLFDRDLRLLLHEGARSAFASDAEAIVGLVPADFAPPDAARVIEGLFREALAGRTGRGELRADERIFEVATYPVPGAEGRVDMGLVITADVTESRAMQARFQAASHLAAVGTLVAGVAHEINNPIALAITGTASALEKLAELTAGLQAGEAPDPEALHRDLEHLVESVQAARDGQERIAGIVADLASFGRPDAARVRIRLDDVAQQALRWLRASLPFHVKMRLVDDGSPEVNGAPGQLAQVLINLVNNAAKGIPANGAGVVTVRLGPGEAGGARIEVRDNGLGMSPALLERIFDPFFSTREGAGGSGLGLAICRAIVTAHGGTLSVESAPGEGSTFRVDLPAAAGDD